MLNFRENKGEPLRVLSQDPFQGITTKTRLRQLLQTHQGRDKLFKIVQYFIRIRLWWNSVEFNINYLPGEEFSRLEQNLMTIVNARRMFRVGRFLGEFARMRNTLIKCSELVYIPLKGNGGHWMALFIQCQMICDMIARALMCVRSFCDDIAFLMQKGFFHSDVSGKLMSIAFKCGLPVLTIDLCLNSLRLYQGIIDASTPPETEEQKESFSLLTKYDRVDKLRRIVASHKSGEKTVEQIKEEHMRDGDVVLVSSVSELLWTDFELHWVCVTEIKILLDMFVAFCNYKQLKGVQGPVSIAGFCSGLCSIYRVWTYGR